MAFENLSIDVSARTGNARRSLRGLNRRLDETADEADEAARSTGALTTAMLSLGPASVATSGSLSSVATTSGAAAVSLGTLASAAGAALVPIGAMAASVGALGVAFAGLGAAGAVTHMSELQTAFAETKVEILDIIEPLGEEFGPLLVTAVESLDDLTEEMVAAIGPTDDLKESMRTFGEIGFDVIPGVTGLIFDLARATDEPLQDFVEFLGDKGPMAMSDMEDTTAELLPELKDLGLSIADLLPDLLEFGTTVADNILPPLTGFVDAADGLLESFNNLPDSIQNVTAKALVLLPVLLRLKSAMTGIAALSAGSAAAGGAGAAGAAGAGASGGGLIGGLTTGLAAGAAGLGLGSLSVKGLEGTGFFEGIQDAGGGLRDLIGGGNADATLRAIDRVPFAREAIVGGATLPDFVAGGDGSRARAAERAFEQAERGGSAVPPGLRRRRDVPREGPFISDVTINANSRAEGREAARGFQSVFDKELRNGNVRDTSAGR